MIKKGEELEKYAEDVDGLVAALAVYSAAEGSDEAGRRAELLRLSVGLILYYRAQRLGHLNKMLELEQAMYERDKSDLAEQGQIAEELLEGHSRAFDDIKELRRQRSRTFFLNVKKRRELKEKSDKIFFFARTTLGRQLSEHCRLRDEAKRRVQTREKNIAALRELLKMSEEDDFTKRSEGEDVSLLGVPTVNGEQATELLGRAELFYYLLKDDVAACGVLLDDDARRTVVGSDAHMALLKQSPRALKQTHVIRKYTIEREPRLAALLEDEESV